MDKYSDDGESNTGNYPGRTPQWWHYGLNIWPNDLFLRKRSATDSSRSHSHNDLSTLTWIPGQNY